LCKEFGKNENVRNYIKNGIENEKAMEFLVANSKEKKAEKKAEKKETAKTEKETTKKSSKKED